jgi:hypothetical protein
LVAAVDGGVAAAASFSFSRRFKAASRLATVAGSSSRSCADRHPKAARNLLNPVRFRFGLVPLAVEVGVVVVVDGPAVAVGADAGVEVGLAVVVVLDAPPAGVVVDAILSLFTAAGAGAVEVGLCEAKWVVSGVAGVSLIVGVTLVDTGDPTAGDVGAGAGEEVETTWAVLVVPICLGVPVKPDCPDAEGSASALDSARTNTATLVPRLSLFPFVATDTSP